MSRIEHSDEWGPVQEEQLRRACRQEPPKLDGQVRLVDYDPGWPRLYEREAARMRSALGDRVLLLEHIGSTSVPRLVHPPESPEIGRNLRFRDHLQESQAGRELYERTKRELAGQHWTYMQQYADAKTVVIEEILERSQEQ